MYHNDSKALPLVACFIISLYLNLIKIKYMIPPSQITSINASNFLFPDFYDIKIKMKPAQQCHRSKGRDVAKT